MIARAAKYTAVVALYVIVAMGANEGLKVNNPIIAPSVRMMLVVTWPGWLPSVFAYSILVNLREN